MHCRIWKLFDKKVIDWISRGNPPNCLVYYKADRACKLCVHIEKKISKYVMLHILMGFFYIVSVESTGLLLSHKARLENDLMLLLVWLKSDVRTRFEKKKTLLKNKRTDISKIRNIELKRIHEIYSLFTLYRELFPSEVHFSAKTWGRACFPMFSKVTTMTIRKLDRE